MYTSLQLAFSRLDRSRTSDYTIVAGNQEFHVHKLVMKATSDYFQALFGCGMLEAHSDKVELTLDPKPLGYIIDYLYHGSFPVDTCFRDVVECASYLQMPEVLDVSVEILLADLDVENWWKMHSFFRSNGVEKGVAGVLKFFRSNFRTIVDQGNYCKEELQYIVDMWEDTEIQLFRYLLVEGQNHLLDQVRYGLMSKEELAEAKSVAGEPCSTLIDKAITYSNLDPSAKVVFYSDKQNQPRGEDTLVFYQNETLQPEQSEEPHDCMFVCEADSCDWWYRFVCQDQQSTEVSRHKAHFADVVMNVNGFLLVCKNAYLPYGSLVAPDQWALFDPRTNRWSDIPSPRGQERLHAAVVFHMGKLYVIGGLSKKAICIEGNRWQLEYQETDDVDTFDFATNTWQISTIVKLLQPLSYHGGCSVKDHIYVLGGWTKGKENLQLERLEPATGRWMQWKLPTPPRKSDTLTPPEVHVVKGQVAYLTNQCSFMMFSQTWKEYHIPVEHYLLEAEEIKVVVIENDVYFIFFDEQVIYKKNLNDRSYQQLPGPFDMCNTHLLVSNLTMSRFACESKEGFADYAINHKCSF